MAAVDPGSTLVIDDIDTALGINCPIPQIGEVVVIIPGLPDLAEGPPMDISHKWVGGYIF